MSFDVNYPTTNEAEALAALIPRDQTCTIPVDDYLLRLVRFCEREDVRNFLFNNDPFHLTHLSNPKLAENAVTGMLNSTRVENGTSRLFSHHVRSMFLMAPVFSTENLNFGFGVHEHIFNPADFWHTLNPGIFGRSLSRFVRDDSSGIMVVVIDFPEVDIIQVDYTQLVNTTGQIHALARFRRRQLQNIYESGIFNLSSLTRAMESMEAAYQVRDCPRCGARPEHNSKQQPCRCDIPRAFPKHPFDMSSFYWNMERRLGTFQGLARVNILENGRRVHGVSCGNRITITGGVDPGLIERLRKWAICSSALPEDPLQSFLPQNEFRHVHPLLQGPGELATQIQPDIQMDLPFLDVDEDWYGIPSSNQLQAPLEIIEDILISTDQTQNERQTPRYEGNEERTKEGTDVSEGTQTAAPGRSTTEGRTSSSESPATSTNPSKSDGDDREEVKKLRAELRRERNRASAQRSNLKKKAEHDARKLEIRTNKEKAGLLRERELALRQENMKLRQQLGGRSD